MLSGHINLLQQKMEMLRNLSLNRESTVLKEQVVSKLNQFILLLEVEQKDETINNEIMSLCSLCVQVMGSETRKTKFFCDKIFELQLMLSELWPKDIDDDGMPIDQYGDICEIPLNERVAATGGRVFRKTSLKAWFLRQNNGQVSLGQQITDPARVPFNRRELEHFMKMDLIKFQINQVKLIETIYKAVKIGDLVSYPIGRIVIGSILIVLFCFFFYYLSFLFSPAIFFIFLGVALLLGFHDYYKNNVGFWQAMGFNILRCGSIATISLMLLYLSVGIVPQIIIPLIPALVGAINILAKCFIPNSFTLVFKETFESAIEMYSIPFIGVGRIASIVLGLVFFIGASIVSSIASWHWLRQLNQNVAGHSEMQGLLSLREILKVKSTKKLDVNEDLKVPVGNDKRWVQQGGISLNIDLIINYATGLFTENDFGEILSKVDFLSHLHASISKLIDLSLAKKKITDTMIENHAPTFPSQCLLNAYKHMANAFFAESLWRAGLEKEEVPAYLEDIKMRLQNLKEEEKKKSNQPSALLVEEAPAQETPPKRTQDTLRELRSRRFGLEVKRNSVSAEAGQEASETRKLEK